MTAGTASSEGVRGAGGASFRLTHETVGQRPQFSSKTADGSRAAGLPRLLRGTEAQPSEPQPRCLHNLISGDVAPVLQTAVGHTDPAWSSKGRAAEEGNQEVRSLGPSGRLVLHHLPILQVSKLRLRLRRQLPELTQPAELGWDVSLFGSGVLGISWIMGATCSPGTAAHADV